MKSLYVSILWVGVLFALVSCGQSPKQTTPTPTSAIPAPAMDYAFHQHTGTILTMYYEDNAQTELLSSEDGRVLVDVYNPELLSTPASVSDILLTTHDHPDHINARFYSAFPGKQLFRKAGEIKTDKAAVLGIPSAHNEGDPFVTENGSNYIYVIDLAGLRIAHFGDIGQDALTPEQLQALGKIDIAFIQLDNAYSQMDTQNQKGFHLIEQIKPHLIVPTHASEAAATLIGNLWKSFYTTRSSVTLDNATLPADTQVLFMGSQAESLGMLAGASEVTW